MTNLDLMRQALKALEESRDDVALTLGCIVDHPANDRKTIAQKKQLSRHDVAIAALRVRLAKPVQTVRPVAQWQPIETAPDGVMLLGCDMKADELRKSFYVFWLAGSAVCGLSQLRKPTHWMPLPAAPGSAPTAQPVADHFPDTGEKVQPVAVPAMTPGYVPVPPQVVEDALTALGHFVSDEGWDSFDMQAMDNLDAYMAQHKARQAAAPKGGA